MFISLKNWTGGMLLFKLNLNVHLYEHSILFHIIFWKLKILNRITLLGPYLLCHRMNVFDPANSPLSWAPLIYQGSLIIVRLLNYSPSSHIKKYWSLSFKIMFLMNTIITQITHRTFKWISNNSLFWNSTHLKSGHFIYSKIKYSQSVEIASKEWSRNYRWYFVYFVMSAFFKLLFFLNKNLICTVFKTWE